ncbi:hypothetical protein EI94DRAFT_1786672 [Lactarius quietus]|nr:hypothetical protein EI94DRAFT_1786672 [Lactarius quietus]
MLRACDLALHSAADSGTNVTDEANVRLQEATRVLSSYSERHLFDLPLTIYSRMEMAKWKDSAQRDRSYVEFEDEWGSTMTFNFVLELSASPSFSEILWNFIRYEDRPRITLEQNPHFYLRFPAEESAYTPKLQHHTLHRENPYVQIPI